LAGAAAVAVAILGDARLSEGLVIAAGTTGLILLVLSLVFGVPALLASLGEWRLRRGLGVIARWAVEPRAWEAFRAFDVERGAAALRNDFTPRPADGPVEVRFGPRQVLVDGSYHPLRRLAVPELSGIEWLQPADAPECIEFGLVYPRGRSATLRQALRVPVAPAARAEAIRVFEHFRAAAPKHAAGLAFRRPWLVIGWAVGVMLACATAGATGWWMLESGVRGEAVVMLALIGILGTIAAAIFTLIILLAVQPWRRR